VTRRIGADRPADVEARDRIGKLVSEAERARVDGGDAGPVFERAIALAREHGFVDHEAIILEIAGRYWASRGYAAFAEVYRAQSRDAYRRGRSPAAATPEVTPEQAVDQLDLATALEVSSAVSSEMVHERLVAGLLSTTLKASGAERALLLLPCDGDVHVEATAVARDGGVDVRHEPESDRAVAFSEALVRHVVATGAPLVLDDAASAGPFVDDPYVTTHRCRSLACIPLTRHGELGRLLYLENDLAARTFTPRRLATMNFIASQAANALENARLYAEVSKAHETERALRETREALGHLARVATLGELTASIAHEVNQPLTAIRVNAATCVRWLDAGKVDEAMAAAGRVGRDAEVAVEVIERLRSLFRKQGTERRALELNEAVAEVLALTRSEITRNAIVAEVRLAPEGPRVLASRVQIQQVMMNLVLNAIQAMQDVRDRPRRLLVTTALACEGRVRTSVQDSGVGVPKEHAAALFRPFFSTKRGGTGVGLSISHSIVAEHEGELWHAHDDGPGATFGFDLPTLP
jgi:signal transduction histidine kinase